MKKSLYIFVDSERPDQYLNSLVYCVNSHDVRRVVLIHIKNYVDGVRQSTQEKVLSGRVSGAVQAQLGGLAERGEYTIAGGSRAGERLLLETEYGQPQANVIQEFYKSCRDKDVKYENEEVDYAELRSRLRVIAREGNNAYVDVTAINKKYLGDFVAACLVEGLRGLYTFELTDRPDYEHPWKMLIHHVSQPPRFHYANIINTQIYQSCLRVLMVRAPRMTAAASATVFLLAAVAAGYWILGSQHPVTQTMFAVSGLASILSLAFVFFSPRGSP